MTRPHVLLLESVLYATKALSELEKVANVSKLSVSGRDEFIKQLQTKYDDIVAIYHTFGSVKATGGFDRDLISKLPPSIKWIAHNGAGYDCIDVQAATERGIGISNVQGDVDASTADTNVFLILGAIRNYNQALKNLRQGKFLQGVAPGHDPENKVLGILGMGGIGRAIHDRVRPFGFKVQYHNRRRLPLELENDAKYVSFDDLLATSDVISVSVPLNKNTHHLIGKEAFNKMKNGVFIVNTARGPVVDEQALVDALKAGKVNSAGLDVYEFEPKVHPDLISNEKVMLLPHVGTYTFETREQMETSTIENIISAVKSGHLLSQIPEQAH